MVLSLMLMAEKLMPLGNPCFIDFWSFKLCPCASLSDLHLLMMAWQMSQLLVQHCCLLEQLMRKMHFATLVLHDLVRLQATFNTCKLEKIFCACKDSRHAVITIEKTYPVWLNGDVPYVAYETGRVNCIGGKIAGVLPEDLTAVISCFFDLTIPTIQVLCLAATSY